MEPQRTDLILETLSAYDQYWMALCRAAEPIWAQVDLTGFQIRCIIVLAARGSETIGRVAKVLAISRSSCSLLIEQLVQRRMVERTEDQGDRRRTLVSLTADGKDLAARLHEGDVDCMRIWVEQLDNTELVALCVGLHALSRVILKSL